MQAVHGSVFIFLVMHPFNRPYIVKFFMVWYTVFITIHSSPQRSRIYAYR